MRRSILVFITSACYGRCPGAFAQTALTWQQVKDKFEADNPNLRAGQLNIQESKAQEITAYLRPNPNLTVGLDQLDPFTGSPYRPFAYAFPLVAFDYLHERQHKRELRLESAQKGTAIAESQQLDLERTLLFNLRSAFVQTLQAKALLANAKENLEYFEKELSINRERFKSGDIARVDLDRLVLQRAQYESDYQTAIVNARTAKITLLMLLNDRTPVDQFDVTGPFEFQEQAMPLEEFRSAALAARPDLKAAIETIDKAETDHKLAVSNGSTDPTFGVDFGRNPPIDVYMGFSVNIPLRIFDKNQGEKARTRNRHHPCAAAKGRRGGAGIQRCRFGLLHAGEFGESVARPIRRRTDIWRRPRESATPCHSPTSAARRRWWTIWTLKETTAQPK